MKKNRKIFPIISKTKRNEKKTIKKTPNKTFQFNGISPNNKSQQENVVSPLNIPSLYRHHQCLPSTTPKLATISFNFIISISRFPSRYPVYIVFAREFIQTAMQCCDVIKCDAEGDTYDFRMMKMAGAVDKDTVYLMTWSGCMGKDVVKWFRFNQNV